MDPIIIASIISALVGTAGIGVQAGLNQRLWEREDTSISRRVRDLEAAGLSPVLAAGQGASSAPVSVGSGFSDVAAAIKQMPLMQMEKDKNRKELDVMDLQKKLLEGQIVQQDINNADLRRNLDMAIEEGVRTDVSSGLYSTVSMFVDSFRSMVDKLQPGVRTDLIEITTKLLDTPVGEAISDLRGGFPAMPAVPYDATGEEAGKILSNWFTENNPNARQEGETLREYFKRLWESRRRR